MVKLESMKEVSIQLQGSNVYDTRFFKNGKMETGNKIEIATCALFQIPSRPKL